MYEIFGKITQWKPDITDFQRPLSTLKKSFVKIFVPMKVSPTKNVKPQKGTNH